MGIFSANNFSEGTVKTLIDGIADHSASRRRRAGIQDNEHVVYLFSLVVRVEQQIGYAFRQAFEFRPDHIHAPFTGAQDFCEEFFLGTEIS